MNRLETNFKPAGEFAVHIAKKILKHGLPKDTLLNVNIPAVPKKKIQGVQIVRQGKRIYRDKIIEKMDPRGRLYYWIGGEEPTFKNEPGTDFNAITENYIAVTPLHLDLTHVKELKTIKKWKLNF